jgi:hypothetical protein
MIDRDRKRDSWFGMLSQGRKCQQGKQASALKMIFNEWIHYRERERERIGLG